MSLLYTHEQFNVEGEKIFARFKAVKEFINWENNTIISLC